LGEVYGWTSFLKSLEQFTLLGAFAADYKLSDQVGIQMARLSFDPMYSKALIVSSEFKCFEEMLIVSWGDGLHRSHVLPGDTFRKSHS
jgi:HrpA-like RNA helicase